MFNLELTLKPQEQNCYLGGKYLLPFYHLLFWRAFMWGIGAYGIYLNINFPNNKFTLSQNKNKIIM